MLTTVQVRNDLLLNERTVRQKFQNCQAACDRSESRTIQYGNAKRSCKTLYPLCVAVY